MHKCRLLRCSAPRVLPAFCRRLSPRITADFNNSPDRSQAHAISGQQGQSLMGFQGHRYLAADAEEMAANIAPSPRLFCKDFPPFGRYIAQGAEIYRDSVESLPSAFLMVQAVADGRGTSVDRPCDHCDHPDISLLRIVLIGEIVCADDDTLYALAGICEALGLIQFSEEPDPPPPKTRKRTRGELRRIK